MARPLRLSFEDALYHITARGNRRDNIFNSERDKSVFLNRINETFAKYSFLCYAYCLMDNHYHLFIKTPLANLTDGMHYLNASYANWFRTKYKIIGPVFQGRYKSIIVDEDNYSLMLSAYIHLNPLRAGIVKQLDKYKWSSFLEYNGMRQPLIEKLDMHFILSQFGDNVSKASERYKSFVLENINMENPLKNTYKGVALGNETFIERIKEKIRSIGPKREIRATRLTESFKAIDIIQKIQEVFQLKREDVFNKQRGNIYRQLALYLIKKYSILSLKEIGDMFQMDYAAVSQAAKRFKDVLRTNKRYLSMKCAILERLKGSNVIC